MVKYCRVGCGDVMVEYRRVGCGREEAHINVWSDDVYEGSSNTKRLSWYKNGRSFPKSLASFFWI